MREHAPLPLAPELAEWLNAHGPAFLKRAHSDGYDVRSGLLDWIATQLVARGPAWGREAQVSTVIRQEDDGAPGVSWSNVGPSAEALLARQRIAGAIAEMKLPASVNAELSRVARVTRAGHPTEPFIGLVLTLTHPSVAFSRYAVFGIEQDDA